METEPTSRVLLAVRALPGTSTRGVAAALGVDESTADYHLRRLAKRRRVVSVPVGRDRCWYAGDCGLCPVLKRATPVLRRPEALAVARALEPTAATAAMLAERASVPVGTVRWVGNVLVGVGLALRTPHGRLVLNEGADVCIAKAREPQRCDAWGRCPVSRAWEAREREAAAKGPSAGPPQDPPGIIRGDIWIGRRS